MFSACGEYSCVCFDCCIIPCIQSTGHIEIEMYYYYQLNDLIWSGTKLPGMCDVWAGPCSGQQMAARPSEYLQSYILNDLTRRSSGSVLDTATYTCTYLLMIIIIITETESLFKK